MCTKEYFIDALFNRLKLKEIPLNVSKETLYKKILRGGYPSVQGLDEEGYEAWIRNYINLLLKRDIKDLANIEKLTELPNLLNILASRSSGLLNVAEISRESKINIKTLHRYIALLETIFLVNMQRSWSANITQRFVKSPKLYMVDSGLLSYLLDMNIHKALNNSTHMGKIVENFVVGELKKQATWNKTIVQLYHCRTATHEEVDIILENRSGEIIGIEIKSNEKISSDDFKGLRYLQDKVKDKFVAGIVLSPSATQVSFGKDLYTMPINALWESVWE